MRRSGALLLALCALAGCGVGEGAEGGGAATIVVTRDFGTTELGRESASGVPAGETVMRLLQRRFDVETRFGGGFVGAIDGLAGGESGGRSVDWFFYVNGIESSEGAGSRKVADGDVIWWDHHDWGSAMRVPAVVGSFPEPFLSGSEGKRLPVRLDCAAAAEAPCDEVMERLTDAGVSPVSKANPASDAGTQTLRIRVGTWQDIRADRASLQLERGPDVSGVFVKMAADSMQLLDQRGEVVRTLGAGAGLIAATRYEEQQPTWVVTGTDAAGVAAAAAALDDGVLADHFALAIDGGRGVPLPVQPERQ